MTTYTQGYRDGLEAAAKVCDEHTEWYADKLQTEYSCVSDSCADEIRNLPVPEYIQTKPACEHSSGKSIQTASVEDVAWPDNVVADRHETTGKWVLWYLTDEQADKAKAAMRACGMKVD